MLNNRSVPTTIICSSPNLKVIDNEKGKEEEKKILSSPPDDNEKTEKADPSSVKMLRVLSSPKLSITIPFIWGSKTNDSPKSTQLSNVSFFDDPFKLHKSIGLFAASLKRITLGRGPQGSFIKLANTKFLEVSKYLESGVSANSEDKECKKPIDTLMLGLPANSKSNIEIIDDVLQNFCNFPKEIANLTINYVVLFVEQIIVDALGMLLKHGAELSSKHLALLKTQGYDSCIKILDEDMAFLVKSSDSSTSTMKMQDYNSCIKTLDEDMASLKSSDSSTSPTMMRR